MTVRDNKPAPPIEDRDMTGQTKAYDPFAVADDELDALRAFAEEDGPVESTRVVPLNALEGTPEFRAQLEKAARLGVSMATMSLEPLPADRKVQLVFETAGLGPIPVTKSVTMLGRSDAADVVVPKDGEVSREHAALLFSKGEFFIEDLESSNGTYVNDKRVKRAKLGPSDVVRIGTYRFSLTGR